MIDEIRHDDVLQLRGTTRTSRAMGFEVSAFLVRGVLVDTLSPALGGELARWLDVRGRAEALRGALVTHHHEDHAGNVDRLIAHGVPVGMAPGTLAKVRRPVAIRLYRRLCWGSARALPGDPAPFLDADLQLLPAPGHTPDHHVVWDPRTRTVFGGDLFIGVKVRIAHPREDVRGQADSLRRIADLRPARLFDGHRGIVPHSEDALRSKAAWIDEVVGRIERHADAGWPATAIAREVLGRGDLTGLLSRGEYAKRNLVDAVLASRPAGAPTKRTDPQ